MSGTHMKLSDGLHYASRILDKSGPPIQLTYFITSRCNLRCSHCFYWEALDADHSHDGVLADLHAWVPYVKHGGVIAGDDYDHPRYPGVRTAWEAFNERRGVCRDFAHLAVTLCRCMNIPARYCTGYMPDIGVPAVPDPMDFAGWFEAFLGGRWYTVDPRNLVPRIGRILIARGRDASDVAIATTFGPNVLKRFVVHAEEIAQA